jgi:TfoX/Sxy family transcriptional regulator of competence genes
MMGEYVLYVYGRVVGGIYDDRLLLKPTDAVCRMIPDVPREVPYEGGREMLLVEEVDDAEFLCALLAEAAKGAPPPRRRR